MRLVLLFLIAPLFIFSQSTYTQWAQPLNNSDYENHAAVLNFDSGNNGNWTARHLFNESDINNDSTKIYSVFEVKDCLYNPNLENNNNITYIGLFDNNHYYLNSDSKAWLEAQSYSIQNDGNLVVIDDANENQFISNFVISNLNTGQYWIGYKFSSQSNQWEWVDLTINNSNTGVDTQVHCDTYTWIDGVTYTSSNNTATWTLTNAAGCDSVVTLDLTINNSNTGVDTQVHCDTYTWIDGNTYTSSNNTATWTLTNAAGCDSIVTLDLTINNSNTGVDSQFHCDTYTWIDGVTYTSSNNTATWTLTNVAGCDSVVTLDLTINNSNTGMDTQVHCDTYTWIDGNTYTSSNNTATHTLTNIAGCDSVVTLDLTINNSNTGVDTQTACDTYTWIDGETYTSSNNTATWTLTNAAGCDSVVTLDLTINNSNAGVDTQVHCDTYTWIDGNTYTESNNTATFTLTNSNNCDSIVTLDLIINNSDNTSSSITACDEFIWDGQTYTESGDYTNTYTNANGCDSTHTLNLTINSTTFGTDTQEHCDTYTWIDGNTYTESNNTATFTLTNSNNCDSIVTLDLLITQSSSSYDTVVVCDSYDWNGNTYTESGNYVYISSNTIGCDSVANLDLSISQLETLVIDGEQIGYTETDNNTYSISNSNASSTYFWNLSNNLGTIETGNANNSEITISWGENDSETTLCVYEQDEYSCEGEESCITIDVKRPTSIDDIEESLLSIYPNPFKNQTTVSFSNPTQSKAILKLIDSRGRTVRNYDGITGDIIIIKKEELSEGLYYIQLNLNNNVIRRPIVIQ